MSHFSWEKDAIQRMEGKPKRKPKGPTPEILAASGTEHGSQAAIFCWAQQNQDKYPELKYLFHVPNGGYRTKSEGSKLKAAGVKSGVPDLFLLVKRHTYSGLIIELKVGKNDTQANQDDWLSELERQGFRVKVCWGYESAKESIINYLGMK